MAKQPNVVYGSTITVEGREGSFVLWSTGSKIGRHWAIQYRDPLPRIEIEVRYREVNFVKVWTEVTHSGKGESAE